MKKDEKPIRLPVRALAFGKKAGKFNEVKERVMYKAKKWTMLVAAFLLSIFALEVLLAEPPIPDPKKPLDEGSWVGITGGGGSAGAPKAPWKANLYLIQFAPTGGFYLIKMSVPAAAAKKPAKKQN